jgi:hypothetical protein
MYLTPWGSVFKREMLSDRMEKRPQGPIDPLGDLGPEGGVACKAHHEDVVVTGDVVPWRPAHQPDAFEDSTVHLTTMTSGNASSVPRQPNAPLHSGGNELLLSLGELRAHSRSSAGQSTSVQKRIVRSVYGDPYFPTCKSLGEGAFGAVVLALHETGGLVAMKQIPLNTLQGGVDSLIQEMELLSSLNHPNIASYVTCAVNKTHSAS